MGSLGGYGGAYGAYGMNGMNGMYPGGGAYGGGGTKNPVKTLYHISDAQDILKRRPRYIIEAEF
jgi:hypothetical protein